MRRDPNYPAVPLNLVKPTLSHYRSVTILSTTISQELLKG